MTLFQVKTFSQLIVLSVLPEMPFFGLADLV